jgi:hypothetical protein
MELTSPKILFDLQIVDILAVIVATIAIILAWIMIWLTIYINTQLSDANTINLSTNQDLQEIKDIIIKYDKLITSRILENNNILHNN